MSQRIYHHYKDDLTSFDHRRQYTGIIGPGRYCGFDTLTPSTLNFTIGHGTTGLLETLIGGTAAGAKKGVHVTRQGLFVHETATITGLSCLTNATNGTIRNDLLIAEHLYADGVVGGTPALYSVVTGPIGSEALPALPNPEKQVILGVISIPANAATLAGATYTPAAVPLPGNANIFTNFPELDAKYAKLLEVNQFTKTQHGSKATLSALDFSGGKLTFKDTGNTQSIGSGTAAQTVNEIEEAGIGTTIYTIINNSSANQTFMLGIAPAVGGKSIFIANVSRTSIVLPQNGWIQLIYLGTAWWVLNSSVFISEIAHGESAYQELNAGYNQFVPSSGDIITASALVSHAGSILWKKIGKILHMWVLIQYTETTANIGEAEIDISTILGTDTLTSLGVEMRTTMKTGPSHGEQTSVYVYQSGAGIFKLVVEGYAPTTHTGNTLSGYIAVLLA